MTNLQRMLRRHKSGRLDSRSLLEHLRELPYRDLKFAKVDLHRSLRRGFPEVIYAKGKSVPQIVAIAQALKEGGNPIVVTKVSSAAAHAVIRQLPWLRHFPEARMVTSLNGEVRRRKGKTTAKPEVLLVTAGTGDIPVAEEAAVILQCMGHPVKRLYDVGVAGLHRLLKNLSVLKKARAIVVVAGMDGALPSVVSGLVDRPVVAVPTSLGYGASFKGVAPLLTMLNSCSPGVAVVNIDNGFGAGYLAARIASS